MLSSHTVIKKDDHFCLGRIKNVVLVIWNKPPSAAALDTVHVELRKCVTEHQATAIILLVRAKGSPGNEANKRAAALLQDLGEKMVGLCTVMGGQDFWSKLTRLAMHSTAALATMSSTKMSFVPTVPEAVNWISALNGVKASKAELSQAMDSLLEQYPAAAA